MSPFYDFKNSHILLQPITPLRVVPANSALRLKAVLDFEEDGIKRLAGDEFLFEGPGKGEGVSLHND